MAHRTFYERAERVAQAIERGKLEILADIESGRVPVDVADFGSLHDYVDANTYAGLCDEGENDWWHWYGVSIEDEERVGDDWRAFWEDTSEVQDRLNDWLMAGRP